MLLYHKADIQNNAWFKDGSEQYQRQSGSYSMYALRNTRTVSVPWMRGTIPSWVTDGLTLSYSGSKLYYIDGQIGAPAQFPRSSSYVLGTVTDRFVPLVATTVYQDMITSQSSTTTVSGMAHIGGIFIPPETTGLGTGVFDLDPDTGLSCSITKNDYEGIVVTKTNGYDYTVEYGYNSFGKLVQFVTSVLTTTSSGFGSREQTTMTLV